MADLPRQLGRYRLLERVGAGGMGEVFLAELVGAAGFRRRCAVKLVLPHRSARAGVATMFEREAMLASRIAHDNVVQVFDYGKEGESLFLVMEFVDGLTLRALAERRWRAQPLAVAEVCALISDAARGLHAIHTLTEPVTKKPLGIVHRDCTPDNILVTREAFAKIGDFGIALAEGLERLTTTGELKGKVPYMAPEQLDGDDVTAAADVFALGVTTHYLVSGVRPFDRATELATMNAIVNEAAPQLRAARAARAGDDEVPPGVEALVTAMLAKKAKDRPAANDVVVALQPFFRDRPRALVDAVLGPPTRQQVAPLETQVVRVRPTDDTVLAPPPDEPPPSPPATLPPTLPATLPPSLPPTLPPRPLVITQPVPFPKTASASGDGPVSMASGELATMEASDAMMIATFKPRRVPVGVAAGGVVGLAVLAGSAVFLWPTDEAGGGVDGGAPTTTTTTTTTDAGSKLIAVAADAGSMFAGDHDDGGGGGRGGGAGGDDGGMTFTEPVGPVASTHAAAAGNHERDRVVELRGPPSITWTTTEGRKLGSGNAKARVRPSVHNVVAVDGTTGGRCNVAVTGGVARFDGVATGALDVRANPYAQVYVGTRDLGTTPIRPLPQLPACTYKLRFVYEAKAKSATVTLQPGKTTPVRVDME